MLASGEQYETETRYNRVLTHMEVVSGVNQPWDVIKSCHEFRKPMQDERQCIEILLFKNSENYNYVHVLWRQGYSKKSMSTWDFLFTKDWESSRAQPRLGYLDKIEIRVQPFIRGPAEVVDARMVSILQIQTPGGSVDYEQHTHRVPALVTLLSELTRRERTH